MAKVRVDKIDIKGKNCDISFFNTLKNQTGTARAWFNERVNGEEVQAWHVGQEYEVEFKDDSYNGETFKRMSKVKPKSNYRGGGGGGAKADPERTAIERDRLALQRADRAAFEYKDALIVSQVAFKEAALHERQHALAENREVDMNIIQKLTVDGVIAIIAGADEAVKGIKAGKA